MDNIRQFLDRSQIESEAAAWLIRLDGDQPPSASDLKALREWIGRSPVHREEIVSLATFWGNNVLTELSVPLGRPDRQKRLAFLTKPAHELANLNRAWYGVAVVFLALVVFLMPSPERPPSLNSTNGLYSTAVGQQKTMTLADGSVVQLNTNSQLEVAHTDEYRDVRLLQGEVHFTVATHTDRPFRVYAGNGRIQAIGTAFSVYLNDGGVNVIVTEGRVAIASFDLPADSADDRLRAGGIAQNSAYSRDLGALEAGQSTTIRRIANEGIAQAMTLDAIEMVDPQELAARLSWRRGLLTFAGDPLDEVVAEISRYTTVNIEIMDPDVRAIKIGGQFPAGETDAMLETLEKNFGLRVTRRGYNSVQISASSD